jgi:hypothetical protein
MSLASVSFTGVDLADTKATQTAAMSGFADAADMRVMRRAPAHGMLPPSHDPLTDDEPKWPAWKVTVFVLAFCGAFWGGIIWLALRLLG